MNLTEEKKKVKQILSLNETHNCLFSTVQLSKQLFCMLIKVHAIGKITF